MSIPTVESTTRIFDILNKYEDKIVGSLNTNYAVSVIAPSATGKSLLIPLYVAKTRNRILVATITNNAARSLAQFIHTLAPNIVCSYLNFDIETKYGPEELKHQESRIVYTSTKNLRRILQNVFKDGKARSYADYSVIMLDEIHTGTVDQTVCVGLWKNAISTPNVMFPRLLMTTATPVDYIRKIVESYTEIDLRSNTTTPYSIERKWISVQTSGLDLYDKRMSIYEEIEKMVLKIHIESPVEFGHIIVFVDTKNTVSEIANNIVEGIGRLNLQDRGAVVLKVHGKMDKNTTDTLYSNSIDTDKPIRKIIVSTNILESSVTIPNVGHVLDSMLRIRMMESSTGKLVPTLVYASRNSSIQAAGRTGRTNPGTNYIFLSEEEFYKLSEEDPPELSVSPIDREILDLLSNNLVPIDILYNISRNRINASTSEIEKLQLIQEATRTITPSGVFCAKFDTLTLRNSLILYNFSIFTSPSNLYFEIVLSSILDVDTSRLFDYSFGKRNDNQWNDIIGKTQVETILNLWNKIGSMSGGDALIPKQHSLRRNICKKLFIRSEVLDRLVKEVDSSISLFQRILGVQIVRPAYSLKQVKYLGTEFTPEFRSSIMDRLIKIVSDVYKDSILNKHFIHNKTKTPIPNAYYKFGNRGEKGISYVILKGSIPGQLCDYTEVVVLSKIPYESKHKTTIKYNYRVLLHLPTPNSICAKDASILNKIRSENEEKNKIESISILFEGLLPNMQPEVTFQSTPLPDLLFESDEEEEQEFPEVPPNILVPARNRAEIESLGKKILESSVIKILELPANSILVPRGTIIGEIQFKI